MKVDKTKIKKEILFTNDVIVVKIDNPFYIKSTFNTINNSFNSIWIDFITPLDNPSFGPYTRKDIIRNINSEQRIYNYLFDKPRIIYKVLKNINVFDIVVGQTIDDLNFVGKTKIFKNYITKNNKIY